MADLCINCGLEPVKGKSKYCSGKCRVAYHRNSKCYKEGVTSVTDVTVTPQFVTVEGVTCYGRPAVKCDEFGTRPSPLDESDIPIPQNRGRYRCVDGSKIDAIGQIFWYKKEGSVLSA